MRQRRAAARAPTVTQTHAVMEGGSICAPAMAPVIIDAVDSPSDAAIRQPAPDSPADLNLPVPVPGPVPGPVPVRVSTLHSRRALKSMATESMMFAHKRLSKRFKTGPLGDVPCYILHPGAVKKLWWDAFAVLILIYAVVLSPMRLGFDIEDFCPSSIWIWEAFVDCSFVVDLVLNFFTAVYVDGEQGAQINSSLRVIAITYLKTWFIIDFVSSAPIDLSVSLAINGCTGKSANAGGAKGAASSIGDSARLIRILRLVKLLKVVRILRLQTRFEELGDRAPALNLPIFKLVQPLFCTFYFAHILSCSFFSVGAGVYYSAPPNSPEQLGSWLSSASLDLPVARCASLWLKNTTLVDAVKDLRDIPLVDLWGEVETAGGDLSLLGQFWTEHCSRPPLSWQAAGHACTWPARPPPPTRHRQALSTAASPQQVAVHPSPPLSTPRPARQQVTVHPSPALSTPRPARRPEPPQLTQRPVRRASRTLRHSIGRSLTDGLAHSLTGSLTHSLTGSLTHSLAHPPTHSLASPLTHSLTHSLAHSLRRCIALLDVHDDHNCRLWRPHAPSHERGKFRHLITSSGSGGGVEGWAGGRVEGWRGGQVGGAGVASGGGVEGWAWVRVRAERWS